MQPAFARARSRARSARRALRITAVASRIGRFGDPGQFTGDPAHRGLGLIALLLTAQLQLRGDRAGPPPRRAPPIPRRECGSRRRRL